LESAYYTPIGRGCATLLDHAAGKAYHQIIGAADCPARHESEKRTTCRSGSVAGQRELKKKGLGTGIIFVLAQ
jgi:hypothetical protein